MRMDAILARWERTVSFTRWQRVRDAMLMWGACMNERPTTSPLAELRSLRKQVAALRKQVSRLDKVVRTLSRPGRLRAQKVVVNSLEIVDASGKLVAEIGGTGDVFCRSLWAGADKNKRGVSIDGRARKISTGLIDLIGTRGNLAAIEMDGSATAGKVKLRNVTSNQQLDLQGDGAALIAYDENGAGTVTIAATSPAGGSITIYGKGASAKARVNIGISHLTNGGSVAVLDAAGKPNGSLGR